MTEVLRSYIPVCDAVGKLFYPNVEVVLHDLESGTLAHIVNAFSKRRVGDPILSSPDKLQDFNGDWVGPYEKVDSDGQRLRAVSIILRDTKQTPIGMMCINYTVEPVEAMLEHLRGFLSPAEPKEKPDVLFSQNWKEHTDNTIDRYLADNHVSIVGLSRADKKALVHYLDAEGIFAIRNVVAYLCQVLKVSRATIYNWLKEVRR